MNKIGLAMMALLLVCGLVGAATIFMDPAPEDSPIVTYHGNGGDDNGVETLRVSNSTVSPCVFTNDDLSFYMWNTKADATGDFYSPDKSSDSDRLISSGVRDLYAVWVYSFTGSNFSSSDSSKYFVNYLYNSDSFIEPQPMIGIPMDLDPSSKSARMQFTIDDTDVVWSFSPEDYTVSGISSNHYYTITFSSVSGAHNLRMSSSNGSSVSMDFDYEGNVFMDISSYSGSL